MFEKIFGSQNISAEKGGDPKNYNEDLDKEKNLEGGVPCPYCGGTIEKGREEFHKSKLCINTKDNPKEHEQIGPMNDIL